MASRARSQPPLLANYVRPFPRDYTHLMSLMSAGVQVGTGMIMDPRHLDRGEELRAVAREKGLELILDPLSVELATQTGRSRSGMKDLPWFGLGRESPEALPRNACRKLTQRIAKCVVQARATAVLAPTHYIDSIPSRWFGSDIELATDLRESLNDSGGRAISIYYPLVITPRLLSLPLFAST